MNDEYHALLSPSGAAKWLACPNSIAAEDGQPDVSDKTASELGTAKHELLALCLKYSQEAKTYLGHELKFGYKVDADIANDVQIVVDGVHDRIKAYQLTGAATEMYSEQNVPISHITAEKDATGAADVIIVAQWPSDRAEICVIDAKFGYRAVEVEENPQLMLYALGALEKNWVVPEAQTAVLVIHQPAVSEEPSEWAVTVSHLKRWAKETATPAANKALLIYAMRDGRALKEEDFNPGEKQCQWCRSKAVCPARLEKVKEVVGDDFSAIADAGMLIPSDLGDIWPMLDFVEDWIKAVRGRVEYELLQGNEVPGTKLVEGRRGNRSWESDDEAEALLKSFRLKQEEMYSFKLLGPKPILELLKDQPRRAKKVESLITQKSGKPHVAHISDKRPMLEIKPVVEEFQAVEDGSDLV